MESAPETDEQQLHGYSDYNVPDHMFVKPRTEPSPEPSPLANTPCKWLQHGDCSFLHQELLLNAVTANESRSLLARSKEVRHGQMACTKTEDQLHSGRGQKGPGGQAGLTKQCSKCYAQFTTRPEYCLQCRKTISTKTLSTCLTALLVTHVQLCQARPYLVFKAGPEVARQMQC